MFSLISLSKLLAPAAINTDKIKIDFYHWTVYTSRDGLYLAYTCVTQKGENEEPPVIRVNLNAFKQILGTELLSRDTSAGGGESDRIEGSDSSELNRLSN